MLPMRWSVLRMQRMQRGQKVNAVLNRAKCTLSEEGQESHVAEEEELAQNDGDKSVMLFPGEGTQCVGMARRLVEDPNVPNVRDMFDRASQILDFDLLKVCLDKDTPEKILNSARFCQPAVLVTNLAAVEKLYAIDPTIMENCIAMAGFGVGEISALIVSGAITFDDGVHLVKIRSEAAEYCSDNASDEPSGLMSIFYGKDAKIGLATEAARKWVAEREGLDWPVCEVAHHLYQGAKVIGGHNITLL